MLDIATISQADAQTVVREMAQAFQHLPLPGGGYVLTITVHVDKQGRKKVNARVKLPQPDLANITRSFPEAIDGLDLEGLPFMRDRLPARPISRNTR